MFARGQDAEHRGLTPGFLAGVRHQSLVRGRAPRHRGLYLGRVAAVTRRGVTLALEGPVKRGDGLVFDFGDPEAQEEGGKVRRQGLGAAFVCVRGLCWLGAPVMHSCTTTASTTNTNTNTTTTTAGVRRAGRAGQAGGGAARQHGRV